MCLYSDKMRRARWVAASIFFVACGRTALEEDTSSFHFVDATGAHRDAATEGDGASSTDGGLAADADGASDADAVADADADADAGADADVDADAAADADAGADADAAPDAAPGCVTDADCDDQLFCTGIETCSPAHACLAGVPFACPDDGVACTVDACDEKAKGCVSSPSDGLCPLSNHCDPVSGCAPIVYAHDADTLYSVTVPGLEIQTIGSFGGAAITDIALGPDGTLYAVSLTGVYTIDRNTGLATQTASTSFPGVNALESGPDGTLYAAAPPPNDLQQIVALFYQIDAKSGTLSKLAEYPSFEATSGDIALVAGRFLATAHGSGFGTQFDSLVELHPGGGPSKVIGAIGFPCVWGLALQTATLYGFTCKGQVISIDPDTGKGTLLKTMAPAFLGAAAR